jgi:cytochrome P450
MIALSVFALLTNPDQLTALREDPSLIDNAIEELLRYLTVEHTIVRTATEDIDLGGHLVKAGDSVTVSAHAANRDPERFADPDVIDLRRGPGGHVAFGHGSHGCLGKELARVELRAALSGLLTRFPTLRLAVAPEEVQVTTSANYSVHTLPITWDEA